MSAFHTKNGPDWTGSDGEALPYLCPCNVTAGGSSVFIYAPPHPLAYLFLPLKLHASRAAWEGQRFPLFRLSVVPRGSSSIRTNLWPRCSYDAMALTMLCLLGA
eukprot:scaffold33427_cov18-Prasinocladus_malaysianus.AAC.1